VYWFVWSPSRSAVGRHTGALFTLFDPNYRLVWKLDLPGEYDRLESQEGGESLIEQIRADGPILAVRSPGGFDLRLVAENARVQFVAEADANSPSGWTIRETEREAYFAPVGTLEPMVVPIVLEPSGTSSLGSEQSRPQAIRDIIAYAFAPDSSIRFVRDDGTHVTLVQLDRAGHVQAEAEVTLPDGMKCHGAWAAQNGQGWLCALPIEGIDERLEVLRLDATDRSAKPLGTFGGDILSELAATPDGGFVLLDISNTRLVCYDATGRERWEVEEGYPDPTKLFSPEDVAATTDGRVAVLDNIRNSVQVFSSAGVFQESIDLVQVLGQKPNYLSSIEPDQGEGLLLKDFEGEPPLWRLSGSYALVGQLSPKDPDGLTAGDLERHTRIAPDGSIWSTDARIFAELDATGRVRHILGESAVVEDLHEPGTVRIDSQGRIAVQDDRTACVHVFDQSGQRIWIGKAIAEDVPFADSIRRIAMAADDSLFVEMEYHNGAYLAFEPDGRRRGSRDFGASLVTCIPSSSDCWAVRDEHLVRLGPTGNVLDEIARRPDHKHFVEIEDIAVAPNGEVAALDGADLLLYEADGKAIGVHRLPDTYSNLAYSGRWVAVSDWSAEVLLVDTKVGALFKFAVPNEGKRPDCHYGFSPSGSELWVVQRSPLLMRRFLLPKE
jgi:hypothetical protein